MAKKKQWHGEAVESEDRWLGDPTTPEVSQPIAKPEPEQPKTLTLLEAKAIVNDAVQPRAAGHELDPRPPFELLQQAKAIVNAAVQPKTP